MNKMYKLLLARNVSNEAYSQSLADAPKSRKSTYSVR